MGPILQRKLRAYRVAYWSIAVAETLCIGALLVALANPAWAPLALLWFGWKFFRRPPDRAIAAAIERQLPQLHEKVIAVVELTASSDGSPEMRENLFADIDRAVTSVEAGRLLSLKPVAALIAATIVANLALSRQKERVQVRVAVPAPASPVEGRSPMTVAGIAAALRAQPESVLRELPSHVRSLDASTNATHDAEAAAAASEALSEFARAARGVPALAELAEQANALAAELAPRTVPPETAPSRVSVAAIAVAPLPETVAGDSRWIAPVAMRAGDAERYPPQYDQQIRDYFERLAADHR